MFLVIEINLLISSVEYQNKLYSKSNGGKPPIDRPGSKSCFFKILSVHHVT